MFLDLPWNFIRKSNTNQMKIPNETPQIHIQPQV
jgi:hypothetical protein